MIYLFAKALLIGFSIAMPIGPIGMLCIKNNLTHGFRIGLATGLGAAFADSFYGFLAGGGLASASQFLLGHSSAIKSAGGAILLYLGLREIGLFAGAVRTKKAKKTEKILAGEIEGKTFFATTATTFLLVLANPATILSFLGVFAAIGAIGEGRTGIGLVIAGVFCGSLAWWLTLSAITAATRSKLSEKFTSRIKTISGLVLIGYGAVAFVW